MKKSLPNRLKSLAQPLGVTYMVYAMNENGLSQADELRLRTEIQVCEELNVPFYLFRRLRRRRLIPVVRLGYRSYRYDIIDVRNAINRLKVKAVS
jgi:hypothetical protein